MELIAEDISDIRLVPRVPSAPSMAANDSASASGQDLQSLQGSLKSSSLGTWPISAFSPNWIIPYSELVRHPAPCLQADLKLRPYTRPSHARAAHCVCKNARGAVIPPWQRSSGKSFEGKWGVRRH